jgi:hypothetical protein
MSRHRLLTAFCVVTLLCLSASVGADSGRLYVGEAAIADASEAGTRSELRALDEVLQRLTGQLNHSMVEQLAVQPSDLSPLILSRQVVRRTLLQPDGRTIDVLRHQVNFDPEAIDQLLRERAVPVWGRERPALLLWVALDDDQGVRLADSRQVDAMVSEVARRYGLTVIQPLGDAIDLAQVSITDIRGGFVEAAQGSAMRYGAGVVIMLDLRQEGSTWLARLFWRHDGRDVSQTFPAISMAVAIDQVLASLLQSLAEHYAQFDDGLADGEHRVLISGVREQVHYREVMAHLTQLSAVESLRLIAADGDTIELVVRVRGSRFEQVLALGGVLSVEDRSADGTLRLRLM